MTEEFVHITVLKHELVSGLKIKAGDTVVDCTLGGGGHTEEMLNAVGQTGRVIAFDRDPTAIAFATKKFARALADKRLRILKTEFSEIKTALLKENISEVNAIGADIGVSSPQIDHGERGFSFMDDAPLDMRMDPSSQRSARDLVNELSYHDLKRIFQEYGEDPKAHYIAQAIEKRRAVKSIETTKELADLVQQNVFYKEKSKKHPATKVFQALRIAVNDELGELRKLLSDGFSLLTSGGRLGVISFHSLEDRIVKDFMQEKSDVGARKKFPKGVPVMDVNIVGEGVIVKPFPIVPSDQEIEMNPRSRSAKLRVIQKN